MVTLGLHSTHLFISTPAAEYLKHRAIALSVQRVECASNFTLRSPDVFLYSAPLQHLCLLANNTRDIRISQRTHNRKENRVPAPSRQIKIYDRHNKSGCKDAGFSTQSLDKHRGRVPLTGRGARGRGRSGSLAELKDLLMIEVRLTQSLSASCVF